MKTNEVSVARTGICCVVALMGALGGAAVAAENNSSLTPLTAQAAVPKAATQVGKIMWLGGGYVWDSMDRVNGSSWNIGGEVCGTLQAEGWFRKNGLNTENPKCNVKSVEQSPKHGKLVLQTDGVTYNYAPELGFIGKDMISFIVDAEGKEILVMWPVFVTEHESIGEGENSQLRREFQTLAQLAEASSLTISFADLPIGAVGQTTGTTITLDTNASGYNWFINPTDGTTSHSTRPSNDDGQVAGYPADNSEFLPTSNPNEWVAKTGSAASGKMDMLSVLLHEYGHALGINHSADPNDYMDSTLTAGVRRLPSATASGVVVSLVWA